MDRIITIGIAALMLGIAGCSDDDFGQERPAADLSATVQPDLQPAPDLQTPPDLTVVDMTAGDR